ncbi:outer membrane lipoprotein carrier protein LolA [Kangiella taiwanensis]|uniref:Outer membrane lipoprotein carrier protein LolA n=1 Tax=Kangiella taiwanensis TaxID=1079179 RepID=A0ABP8HX75_9GAMM|nr:outer membrane lipoprotein carrier protein LolA [Kangiella taiwanensis]
MMTTLTQYTAFLLLIASCFIPSTANACVDTPCELNSIAKQISSQPQLNEFKQLKTVAVLTQPLKSSGYLLLADNDRVVWQTQKPIKSTTVIGPNSFKQYNKQDEAISAPANSNNQTSQLISSTFLSILSGDFEELNTNFDVIAICKSSGWSLNLTSTHSDIQRVIKHIEVSGNTSIQRLTFTEANGDITQITFDTIDSQEIHAQLGQFLVD